MAAQIVEACTIPAMGNSEPQLNVACGAPGSHGAFAASLTYSHNQSLFGEIGKPESSIGSVHCMAHFEIESRSAESKGQILAGLGYREGKSATPLTRCNGSKYRNKTGYAWLNNLA